METKEIKIQIPKGYEIDKENSTYEKIVFKEKEQPIKTFNDLKEIKGYYIHNCSGIKAWTGINSDINKNVFLTKKYAKSALAMSQISQLMPYYGGEITDEEWKDFSMDKFGIIKTDNKINVIVLIHTYNFLAFHTQKERDEFIKNNEQLVKDYLMID